MYSSDKKKQRTNVFKKLYQRQQKVKLLIKSDT